MFSFHYVKMFHTVHIEKFTIHFIVLSVALLCICDINAGLPNRSISPTEVEVREGEDVQVRLLNILSDETTCYVKTPLLINCNLKLAGSEKNAGCERVHYWPVNGACGFKITNVQKQDNGTWRLTSQSNDKKVVTDVVKISVSEATPLSTFAVSPVITRKGEILKLQCSSNKPLNYCWFSEPNGEVHKATDKSNVTFSNLLQEDDSRFDNCEITIKQAEWKHNGTWTCHMGSASLGTELTEDIHVEILGPETFMGITKEFVFDDDDSITLQCKLPVVSPGMIITCCRFISPTGLHINVDEHVTKSNPIEYGYARYWYGGLGLAFGDCALTVEPTSAGDGFWECMADLKVLDPDVPNVPDVPSSDHWYTLGNTYITIAIVFGTLGCVIALLSLIATIFKYGKRKTVQDPKIAYGTKT